MKRRGNASIDAPGHDSFLDIVANLVGILIILVIVVGVRARDALDNAPPPLAISADEAPDVEAAQAAANAIEQNLREAELQVKKQQFEIAYRQKERDKMLLLLTAREKALEQRTEALDAAEREQFQQQQQTAQLEYELAKLNQQRASLENQKATKKVLRHLPTPMAKTVFGREVHFRLLGGRIMFVPWDELVAQLKADFPQKVWKLQDSAHVTETIGPIGGFWMKYTMKRASYAVETRAGAAVQKRVELDNFKLIPVAEGGGESLEQARKPQSEFREVLARFQPERSSVTVWVYPDSFDQFRLLKEELFKMGYLTAGRPMPEGKEIGGSPRGTRSAGQ